MESSNNITVIVAIKTLSDETLSFISNKLELLDLSPSPFDDENEYLFFNIGTILEINSSKFKIIDIKTKYFLYGDSSSSNQELSKINFQVTYIVNEL